MRVLVAAVALVSLTAACDVTPSEEDASWQHSTDPVPTSGLPFVVGSTVQLGDGTIDTGIAIAAFVVAGDGIYFVEDDDPADDHRPATGTQELLFAARDGEVVDTGVEVLVPTLRASPDGRHLAAIDMASGKEDDHGTPQAALVVWNLRTGEEVVRSTEATGDPDEDDFAALYPELEMSISSIDDASLRLDAVGTWSYDFATGAAERLTDDTEEQTPPPPLPSPDGGRVELYGWLDDDTTYGVQDGTRDGDPAMVVTCEVRPVRCAEIRGTAGQYVILPNGLTTTGLDLRDG